MSKTKMSNASTKANRIIKSIFYIRGRETEAEIKENKPFKTVTMGDHNYFYINCPYTMSDGVKKRGVKKQFFGFIQVE